MHTIEEIYSAVLKEIADFTTLESFSKEANLRNDLSIDSLEEVEIIMNLEKLFNVSIPDEDAEACKTVQDVIDLFLKHVKHD